ncbi:MAG: hypothetical protein IPH84_16105 [Bacteroidales bacterium]|nr:hypothetical protein [Bacteroidales bacterium]
MKNKILVIILLMGFTAHNAISQVEIKYFKGQKQTMEFDFFQGPDAADFGTTFKGFGSLGNTFEKSMISIDGKYLGLFANLGYSIRYYRFQENLKFSLNEGVTNYEIVKNPDYEFTNKFFSWSKNKMVIGYLLVPVGIDIKTKYADVRLQASYTRYIAGKHKVKYVDPDDEFEQRGKVFLGFLVADEKEKYKTPNSDFKEFNLNKNNVTAAFEIIPKKEGKRMFGIGFRYDVLPLFVDGKGPEIHEVAIYLTSY